MTGGRGGGGREGGREGGRPGGGGPTWSGKGYQLQSDLLGAMAVTS